MRFQFVPKSMTVDDLEQAKDSLPEKIVLRSPPGSKSWKLIAQLAQHLRSSQPKGHSPTQGNMGKFGGD